jgi:DNA-binding GntR family transcriptional regulator
MEPKFPYRRIADDLRDKIESGELTGQIPTRAKLAEQYGVAYMTVDRAIRVLKDEGLVYGVAGLGVFVSDRLYASSESAKPGDTPRRCC